jgi:cell division transport system permease protein
MSRLTFFIAEALRAMRRNAAPSIAAVVTIVVTTMLLGVLIPVLRASADKTNDVRSQIGLQVYLHDDTTKQQRVVLQHRLGNIRHVTGVDYVSKQQAVKDLKKRYPKNSDIVDFGLHQLKNSNLPANPLPASFNLSLDDPDNLEAVRQDVEPVGPSGKPQPISSQIQDVSDSRQEANKIRSVTSAIKIVLGVITVLLLIASLMLVGNTIRLSIYSRRREVEVMRLVGATNWFIRWPFVLEGLIVGLLGAGIAIGILWLGKVTIVDPLSDNFDLVANLQTMGFAPLVAILAGAAMAVSALGSGVTLRRFLRV